MRFAEFELDSAGGELRRNGRPVKLERIPMQLLCLLIARRGEVVTRDQIIEHLWGKSVFLDTDNGINTAVRKVRIALNDDSDHPRFISTLPGRGYRFVAEFPNTSEDPWVNPAAANPTPRPASSLCSSPTSNGNRPTLGSAPDSLKSTRPAVLWAGGLLVSAAMILFASFHWISARRNHAQQNRVMLAVLPFQNLSGDPAQDYFADGMTEEMITQLGAMNPEGLGVIARTSAMHYRHTSEDVAHIAQELAVDYVLEGSVRRSGNQVRVTAQLIQAKDQTHLWAQDYDRRMSDVLQIQTSIAAAIAGEIRLTLPAAKAPPAPVNADAYESYLRGMQDLEQRTQPGLRSAIAELTQAISLDPQYAAAWAELSRTYSLSPVFGILPAREAMPKARDAAERAISLDERSPVAHCTLAFVMAHFDFDWPGAEREFQRAIALNPSDPYSHLFYSNSFLSPKARHDQAIAEMKTAVALDPLSFPVQSFLGRTLLWAGHFDEALSQFAKANRISPNSALGHVRLAHTYSSIARYQDAIAEEEKARILTGETPEAAVAKGRQLRDSFKQRGARGYWEQQLKLMQLHDNVPESYTGSYGLAVLYTQLADPEKAMTALNQAFTERDLRLTEIAIEPLFNPLHTDPSFNDFETRLGLHSIIHRPGQ